MPRVTTLFKVAAALAASVFLCGVPGGSSSAVPVIPIFEASEYLTEINRTANGLLQRVSVVKNSSSSSGVKGSSEELQGVYVMHLFGGPREMGVAHGRLLGQFGTDFLFKALPEFFKAELESVDLSGLPKWIADLFDKAVVPEAPEIFEIALQYVYTVQQKYLQLSPSRVLDEIAGMAQGFCDSGVAGLPTTKTGECDVNKLNNEIVRLNLLPELIRMSCSVVGATGNATPSGGLNQLRALDFGSGPFANYSVLTVYHPDEGNAIASLGFAGFANVVTGISEYVGVSEKVHEVYNNDTGLQPGTYRGRAVATVMREMLQFANSTQQAIEYARAADRTWSVFLGFGDTGNNFDVLQYHEKSVEVFDWRNISQVTHSVPIEDITYVDRHPQPTHEPDMMPTILKENYGNLSIDTFAQLPQQLGPTGDVHIAVYDYPNQQMLVSIGIVDKNGEYGPDNHGMAANRPFLRFDLKGLWNTTSM